jgi:DNA-binding winged helix-turn-helix (wHTH) protein
MIYVFDEHELDLQRYELRRGGKPVKLEPQVFNLLAYLIQHRDRLVSKEELFEQVWSGRVVSEAALTSRLMAARRAIGDRGRDQHVIQTVHGRGYRFIATVEERADKTPGRIAPHKVGQLPVFSAKQPPALIRCRSATQVWRPWGRLDLRCDLRLFDLDPGTGRGPWRGKHDSPVGVEELYQDYRL